jgi:hypothetical protein
MPREIHHAELTAYFLIAIAALLTGFLLGQLHGPAPDGSRIDWPKPNPPHPRSLNP